MMRDSERAPRPSRPMMRESIVDQAAACYLALLIPTLIFKCVYVSFSFGGDWSGFDPAISSGALPLWRLYAGKLLALDYLDVFIIVGLLFGVGRFVLKVPTRYLACGGVLASFVVGGANLLSLQQVGTLLSPATLTAAWHWGLTHPGVMRQFVSAKTLVAIGLSAIWVGASLVLMRYFNRAATRERFARRYFPHAALAALLAYGLLEGAAFIRSADRSPLIRGFWSSVALSLMRLDDSNPLDAPPQSPSQIASSYRHLVFQSEGETPQSPIVNIPASQRIPRHIVIVSLETAPRKFYPIADNPMLPVFHAMSQHALVSDRHYASAPATSLAIYSLMTGTYPRPGEAVSRYGPFETDGLPTVLARHGYESTFIDSYDLSWNGQEDDGMLRSLGFSTILDSRQLAVPKAPDAYTYRVRQEARSFDAALDAIRGAASRGRKALVFVATILGHYDWVSPPGTAKLSAAEKLAETARVIDGLMGKFLTSLAQQGLADDMLIVVTGDHGLRFKLEFESLHEPAQYSDATFNVPFMVYAPALFPSQVRLPYSTSHVDLAPTLLDLVGVTRDGGLYHGDDMLDRRLESRVTFLPSGLYPGLHPVDGFCWRDSTYSVYSITHRVTVRVAGNPISHDFGAELEAPFSAEDARRMVSTAKELFNATAAEFLRRRAQR